MPALQNKKYFNYGGQGPLPKPSLKAITNSWEKIQDLGPFTNNVWPFIAKELAETREYLAKMSGVTKERIALTENVTSGCVLPLWGLPFSIGDEILLSDCEHPGVVSACKELARRQQLSLDILPVKQLRHGANEKSQLKDALWKILETYIKPKTKLVVLSHLLWNTGQEIPISMVSKYLRNCPSNPFLLVDAAQSFGHIEIKEAASQSDIYAFTGHKWACGPEGLGGVVLSERVLHEANPTIIGWKSLQHEGVLTQGMPIPFHQDSRRFEIATSCIPLLAGLRCSLELLEEEGEANQRLKVIKSLSSRLWNQLNQIKGIELILNSPPPGGLVSFQCTDKDSSLLSVKALGKKNLWIRSLEDPVCLRACLHVTSTEEEVDALITSIQELTRNN